MKYYFSHRGNLTGPNPERENSIDYIKKALNAGFDVEVDIFYHNGCWYSGHDKPTYKFYISDLPPERILYHCKNSDALVILKNAGFNCFYHTTEDYVLSSKGQIICHSNVELLSNSICMLPERGYKGNIDNCLGVCSDFIIDYENKLK